MPRKFTIEDAKKIAEQRGGKYSSEIYLNSKTKLKWQCEYGHIWNNRFEKIMMGQWCPHCAHRVRLTIEEMRHLASKRGGKCLSQNYKNKDSKLEWECADGHRWIASGGSIKRNSWCPICAKSGISERICRVSFEKLFSEKFPKFRPKWLVSPKGHKMELDGYCEKLKLAFEYQGQQHYVEVAHFHRNKTLSHQQNIDLIKRDLCKKQDIVLIEIPYTIKKDYIAPYIVSQLLQKNIKLPENISPVYLDGMKKDISSPHRLKDMQRVAERLGGKCLSNEYVDSRTKLRWECKQGHTWQSTPNDTQQKKWCPTCARIKVSNSRRLTIEEMKKIAKSRGGKCLSTEYKNNRTHLLWECKKGHTWKATPDNIKVGKWCVKCHRLSIEDMQNLAREKNGECLSKEYKSDRINLLWKCKEGHEWSASSGNIKRGRWCPYCYRNRLKNKKKNKS